MNHFFINAKAYVALVGALAAAALTEFAPDSAVFHVLTLLVVLATAYGVWASGPAVVRPPEPTPSPFDNDEFDDVEFP